MLNGYARIVVYSTKNVDETGKPKFIKVVEGRVVEGSLTGFGRILW